VYCIPGGDRVCTDRSKEKQLSAFKGMISRYGLGDFNIASELNDMCLLKRKQEVNTADKNQDLKLIM
jgi:hypothetical protein